MGLTRFREWIDAEGYRGSAVLLQYYEDLSAYSVLIEQVEVGTDPSVI